MSKKESSLFGQIAMPILVLTAICLVCSTALAFTQQTTKPTIDAAAAREAEQARTEVFPGAAGFTKLEGELLPGITEVYEVDGGGYVVTATTKGFGGAVDVMTGVSASGEILGIKILAMNNETSGLGTQIAEPDYLAKYIGQTNVDGVETIAGSTVTSAAFKQLEQNVLAMYQQLSGGAAK